MQGSSCGGEILQPDVHIALIWGAIIDLRPVNTPQASLLGGPSDCDPPDPISNSAVKPVSADGTMS